MSETPRREFFRQVLGRALRPVADFLEKRIPLPAARIYLRPPSAIAEDEFLNACQRCGKCVEVCPAHCIFPMGGDTPAAGTPVINADDSPCVVCEGLQCTHVCPSGALLPLLNPRGIHMGMAEVYDALCVRTAGEDCTLCVDRCPIGSVAIRFNNSGPPEVLNACVGCGVCQFYCPTTPKSIVVRPS